MKQVIEKAFVSLRIGTSQWMPENRFRQLLTLLEKYRGLTDEITFFTSETHAPLPSEEIAKRAALLAKRMAACRRVGFRAGINILATIGHHEENLPYSLSGEYSRITDIEGKKCLGSFCPNDERMQAYIEKGYEILAEALPDYIWIDDDVRLLGHMPILYGCFCDRCLRIFAEECGKNYTRESLKAAFDSGPLEKKREIRLLWLRHNRRMLAKLLELIEKTVHRVKPGMPLGFMTGDRFYEGYDFDRWAEVLSGPEHTPVMWRPGGGFYSDESMRELIAKSHAIGRQVSMLPDYVLSIQSEVENFPYQRLKKAARTTALEAASHVAAGCTGAAFNILSMHDEPLDEYEPLLAHIRDIRPFLDLMARTLGRSKPKGVYTGWNKDTWVANNLAEGTWMGEMGIFKSISDDADEIFEIGIPACYRPAQASVTVLSGDIVLAMKEEEILRALSSGAYIDGKALEHLNGMGYSELTGFAVERWVSEDCIEVFADDPLNGPLVGRKRDARQSFRWWGHPAAMLKPLSESARILSRAVDYAEAEIAPCCMGAFENRRGGRVAVAGYYPWTFLQNLSKSSQMKSLFRWLSRDGLPGYITSFHKINLWIRELETGGLAIGLLNSSLDTAKDVTLMLLTDKAELSVFDMKCSETKVKSTAWDGPYRRFILPPIEGWQMRFIKVPGGPTGQ